MAEESDVPSPDTSSDLEPWERGGNKARWVILAGDGRHVASQACHPS